MSVKRLPNSSIKVVARNSTTNHDSRTAVPRKSNRCIMGGPTMHSCDLCTCVCKEKGRNDTCRYLDEAEIGRHHELYLLSDCFLMLFHNSILLEITLEPPQNFKKAD